MAEVIDLALERARRGLPNRHALSQYLAPEPPPGYRRGSRVLLTWTGEIGTVLSHRWVVDSERLALRLTVQTPTRAAACGVDAVVPLPATPEQTHG